MADAMREAGGVTLPGVRPLQRGVRRPATTVPTRSACTS